MSLIAFTRKPHPNSSDHEVLTFKTKVTHELCIPKGLDDKKCMEQILKYLKGYDVTEPDGKVRHEKGYEDIYPETAL